MIGIHICMHTVYDQASISTKGNENAKHTGILVEMNWYINKLAPFEEMKLNASLVYL